MGTGEGNSLTLFVHIDNLANNINTLVSYYCFICVWLQIRITRRMRKMQLEGTVATYAAAITCFVRQELDKHVCHNTLLILERISPGSTNYAERNLLFCLSGILGDIIWSFNNTKLLSTYCKQTHSE